MDCFGECLDKCVPGLFTITSPVITSALPLGKARRCHVLMHAWRTRGWNKGHVGHHKARLNAGRWMRSLSGI
jgi:hypothetical protein